MVERRRARSAWADFLWRPGSVFTGSPSAAPWTPLGIEAETAVFYAGVAAIELHRARLRCGSFCAQRLPSLLTSW
jgi:hypothetical protein